MGKQIGIPSMRYDVALFPGIPWVMSKAPRSSNSRYMKFFILWRNYGGGSWPTQWEFHNYFLRMITFPNAGSKVSHLRKRLQNEVWKCIYREIQSQIKKSRQKTLQLELTILVIKSTGKPLFHLEDKILINKHKSVFIFLKNRIVTIWRNIRRFQCASVPGLG